MSEIDRARIQIYNDLHKVTHSSVKHAIETKQRILNDATYPKLLALLQELDDVTRGSTSVNVSYDDEQSNVTAGVQLWLEAPATVRLYAWGLPFTGNSSLTEIWPPKEETS